MAIELDAKLDKETVKKLNAGDEVLLSGVIYTARDAAHKRLVDLLDNGEELPIDLENRIIYFVGPSPAKPGEPIGSAGPTTSYRMDAYSPRLIKDCGLSGMIGKGDRSKDVVDAMKEYSAVYFAATGGAAALIAKSVVEAEIVTYEDLGPEAIRKLTVKNMPLIVAIDSNGNSLYTDGPKAYRK